MTTAREILTSLVRCSAGIPPTKLCRLARELGVEQPLKITRSLIEEGLFRLDEGKNGRPSRVKATKRLFD